MQFTEKQLNNFFKRVNKVPDGCWLWTGCLTKAGYGHLGLSVKKSKKVKYFYAHRISYSLSKGEIPPGYDLDHICRNRKCINPDHLEPVTRQENLLRGIGLPAKNAIKTHCPKGHPYTPENTYWYSSKGGRQCRTCIKLRQQNKIAS